MEQAPDPRLWARAECAVHGHEMSRSLDYACRRCGLTQTEIMTAAGAEFESGSWVFRAPRSTVRRGEDGFPTTERAGIVFHWVF